MRTSFLGTSFALRFTERVRLRRTLRPVNLTSPEVFKIPNENVVIQILSGYKAQSGTVAKSFITPSLSKSSLMSLGMFVIKLCPSLLPTCK